MVDRMTMMVWSRLAMGALAAAGIALATAPAHAQLGQSDAPVEITARQGEYLQHEGRGVYTGNVVATQGESRITTDKLTVICQKTPPAAGTDPSCDEMEVLVAEGNVYYIAPDVRIRGDKAEYDFPTDTITITGDVILSRGEDGVVRGTNVKYSIGEGRTLITAGEKRVTTVFNTAKKNPPAEGAAPATPAPAAPTTPPN
jgi:lipopolysaccharide export system protein LptA